MAACGTPITGNTPTPTPTPTPTTSGDKTMNGLYSGTVSDYSDTFDAQVTSSTSTSGTITFKDTNDSD